MSNYKMMYGRLFNAVTKAIELLQDAQAETEEIIISDDENEEDGE